MTMQQNTLKDGTPQQAAQRRIEAHLPVTSPFAGTGTEELVPSRYALRIGDIDVLVTSVGFS